MYIVIGFGELSSCDILVKRVLKDMGKNVISNSAALDALRDKAKTDKDIIINDEKQIVMFVMPDKYFAGIAMVFGKHYDGISTIVKSLVQMLKALEPLVKDLVQDLKETLES